METKKAFQNPTTNEEAIPKHQHNTAPQHLRLLQYGLKIPSQQPHAHQQLNSPLHLHLHQHNQQIQYQHRHLQPSPQFNTQNNQNYAHQHKNLYQATQPPPLHPHSQVTQNSPQIWVPHQPPVHYHYHHQPQLQQQQQQQAAPPSQQQQQQQQQPPQLQQKQDKTPPQLKPKDEHHQQRKKTSNTTPIRSPSAKRPPEAPVTMQGWLHKQGSEGLMLWKKRWFVLSEYCLFYYKGPEEEKLLGSILLPSYKVSICGPENKVNKKFAFKCEHANMRTYILAADSQELMMQWIRVLNLACLLQSNVDNDQQSQSVPSTYHSTENSDSGFHQQYQNHQRTTPIHMHSSSNTTDLSTNQELSQYNQPLYANAPPKPRRLNDGCYSSPSPDILDRYQPQYPNHPVRNIPKSPVNLYINSPEYLHRQKIDYGFTALPQIQPQNVERRTPDTYGRSKLNPKSRQDYEDVYAEQIYKRPLSPIAYNHVKKTVTPTVNPAYRAYTPVNMLGPIYPPQMRKSPSTISRPHSADFLEYELNHRQFKQQPRPKSSLDINRNSNDSDNYFYSEERYAENMRKSAQYLPHTRGVQKRVVPSNDNTFPLMRSTTQPTNFDNMQIADMPMNAQPVRSRSVLSEGSLSKELDVDLRTSPQVIVPRQEHLYNYNDERNYDQFTRSASARLTQTNSHNNDGRSFTKEGDRKREESMKRLLEWKQRMLQSPLNRKAQNRSYPSRPEYYYKNPDEYYYKKSAAPPQNFDGRRSATNLPQYNSYSSDDEENVERSKENVHAQAGRTLDTYPNNTESLAPTNSITVFNLDSDKSLHDNKDDATFTKPLIQNKESSNLAHVSSLKSEFNKFEQASVTEIRSNGALVKSILAEFEKKTAEETEENYMTMTPKKNVLEPRNSTTSESTVIVNEQIELEENPYVEMNQSVVEHFSQNETEQQPYEMVCFNEGKLEPLYMELQKPQTENNDKLPDIVVNKSKSDSSDADDEASKDLDSLDTPSHPRFSLSDNFRPASYYLGAQTVHPDREFQDSSDSELVSPPPIPTSPPPLDELDLKIDKSEKEVQEDSSSINTNESEVEIRLSKDYERMLKRRPVSEQEFCDELDGYSVDLDKYLTDLQSSSDNFLINYHDYENLYIQKNESILSNDDYTQRCRPESSASTSAEICNLLQCSNRSTPSIRIGSSMSAQEIAPVPYFSDRRDKSNNSSFNQPAPYYYSDLSMNTSNTDSTILTLNNQRCANGNKRDITHIINPIRNGMHQNVENTCKLAAEARSVSVDFLNLTDKSGHIDKKNIYESDTLKRLKDPNPDPDRNLYPIRSSEKFHSRLEDGNVRRSYSLEGLLENVLSETDSRNQENSTADANNEGSYLWEEDSVWRERLRLASQRHTKSMDDLDCIGEKKRAHQKKTPRGITRGVTYVNDSIYNMPKTEKSEIKKEGSFIIDREKLRQWDLLSSAPSDDQLSNTAYQTTRGNTVVESNGNETSGTRESASGSISITRDTFPRAISAKRIWTPNSSQTLQTRSVTNLRNPDELGPQQYYYQEPPPPNVDPYKRKENWTLNDKMNVSAGELLGRTHEELVLLLIQLRRQSANILQATENCYNEIDTIQAQLQLMDQAKRLENLQKLEQIKQHLIELEKQYEKGKPLVNLVDNMVKLGSLYRGPNDRLSPYIRDRLEFNQQIQERRLLAEERRDWNRLNPSHFQLQEKVQQLYQLDRLIQEESGTLQQLQQDKEDIERALGGLRMRLHKGFNDPAEIEQARKLQANLENELSRVHLMLAQNSKKLEETVAGNARLEQELLVLKQKLQISRQQRSSPQFSNAGDSLPCVVGTSAMLESDLQRVQQKVSDLQKQRQELSMQVRQLTDRSILPQQVKQPNPNNQCNKKKVNSLWRETDLDTMNIIDHGDWDQPNQVPTTPLYINTDIKQTEDYYNRSLKSSDSTSDDTLTHPSLPHEKQEIKTVRIVKRESERRQRDREKTVTGKWDALLEEDTSSSQSSILFRPTPVAKTQSSTNIASPTNLTEENALDRSVSSPSLPQFEEKIEMSPVFKSEAARQIITEMTEAPKKRAVPKEKRRHYTAPNNNLIMKSLNQLPTDSFDKVVDNRRARDDLDMERALRQRIDAPDVVRSTLSNKELKYNENTIDNILGTPNKISIPERYIPEQLPQLSAEEQEHRLRKVESIKKMLSDTAIISSSSSNLASDDKSTNSITNKATTKMIEEKKQREHLLQLNQILAKQVMEMSKIVAVKALATLPLQPQQNEEDEDSSPVTPLPLYQQRDNFYS